MPRKKKSRRQALKLIANTGVIGGISLYSQESVVQTVQATDSRFERIRNCSTTASVSPPQSDTWPQKRYDATASAFGPNSTGPTSSDISEKWRFDGGPGKILTPIVANGVVYGLRSYPDAGIVALDHENGNTIWQTDRESLAHTPPVVRNGTVYAGYGNTTTQENKKTNKNLHSGTETITSFTLANESILVGTGAGTPTVTSVAASSGSVCWSATLPEVAHEVTGIAVMDGTVFISTYGRETDYPDIGTVTALDPESGEIIWEVETTDPAFGVSASNTTVFIRTESSVSALDAKTGESRWQVDTRGGSTGTPTVADGTVLFGSLFEVTAVDSTSGRTEWRYETRARNVRPVVADDTVYFTADAVSDHDALMGALVLKSGEELWREQLGSRHLSSPTVAEQTVLVSAQMPGNSAPGQESYEPETTEIIAYE